jgi:hypothetical protein
MLTQKVFMSGTSLIEWEGLAKRLAQRKFLTSGLLMREAAALWATRTYGCHPSSYYF